MRLFEIDDNYEAKLNKEWLSLIPEFAYLLKRDKGGGKGDYRGDKKLRARKEFAFIYFMLDFASPLYEWEPAERREEALRYTGLTEKDIDPYVMAAHDCYETMLHNASRSLRTLNAVYTSLDQLDNYFSTLDFTEKDKKGELVHTPSAYLLNLQRLNTAYASVDTFKARVAQELKQGSSGIRGTATLGGREARGFSTRPWKEGKPIQQQSEQVVVFEVGDTDGILEQDDDN